MSIDSAEDIIRDFIDGETQTRISERITHLGLTQPDETEKLLTLALQTISKDKPFMDTILNFLGPAAFHRIAEKAINAFHQNQHNEFAERLIALISLQMPTALHSYLDRLFELRPNQNTYYENWPWRGSDAHYLPFLLAKLTDAAQPKRKREKAWCAMLETRDPSVLRMAIEAIQNVESYTDLKYYLFTVGFEIHDDQFRKLYSDVVYHIKFDSSYFVSEMLHEHRDHPTWQLIVPASFQVPFGGTHTAHCKMCGQELDHFITFESLFDGLPVTNVSKLVLATCFSCLISEQPTLFFKHERDGQLDQIGYEGPITQARFPQPALVPTQVHVEKTEDRWRWQDWALSNRNENLNRIGGFPCWIQSAEHPSCPQCGQAMTFLLEIDSGLPSMDGGRFDWGDIGICYVFWCDSCKISGYRWQST